MSEVDATPAAQELADEKGLDLSEVKGSGKDGRVLVEDVEAALEEEAPEADKAEEVDPSEETDLNLSLHDENVAPAENAEETDAEEEVEGVDEEVAAEAAANSIDPEAEQGDLGGPGSTDWVRNRGLRERGFYVLPDETNKNVEAPVVAPAPEDATAPAEEAASKNASDSDEPLQTGQVDTSGTPGSPSDGESLEDKSPAVEEVTGE